MKVFLVDDEIVIREGIRESFPWDETPYDLVGEAPDGEMALPMIRDTNPDIVITDIKMPFMDGLELCRMLRTQMPWIGIIVLSGYDEFEYARQCIQLGVREYLVKPISSANLKEALDKISAQILQERKSLEHASSLRSRMGNDSKLIKEKLIGSLFSDEAAPEDAVNADLGMSLDDVDAEISDEFNAVKTENSNTVTIKSASLTVGALSNINISFALAEGADVNDYKFTINGNEIKPKLTEDTYTISMVGISPENFDEMYLFKAESKSDAVAEIPFPK